MTHWSLGLDAPSSSPAAMMNRASLFTRRRSRQPANTRKKRDPIYELNLPVPESIYNAFVRSLARALSRRVRDVRYRTVPLALRLIARLAQWTEVASGPTDCDGCRQSSTEASRTMSSLARANRFRPNELKERLDLGLGQVSCRHEELLPVRISRDEISHRELERSGNLHERVKRRNDEPSLQLRNVAPPKPGFFNEGIKLEILL